MDIEPSPWNDSSSPPDNLSPSLPDSLNPFSSSPFNNNRENDPAQTPPPNLKTTPAAGRGRGVKRVVTRAAATVTTIGDPMGPLGPLGAPVDEDTLDSSAAKPHTVSFNAPPKSDNHGGEPLTSRPRQPPPVDPPSAVHGSSARPQRLPSISVVEAARPVFKVDVVDPHKVGDLTSKHIEYNVQTATTSKAYRNPEFTVSRRFNDFRWLFDRLHINNPGIIVPPPPDKQAVGRFDTSFVEARRQALERMLRKVTSHEKLQHDADLKMFLESDSFYLESKNKERKEPLVQEHKIGFLGIGFSTPTPAFVEHDQWFLDRRAEIENLEQKLKDLSKALDIVLTQRKHLAASCDEFGQSIDALAKADLAPLLSDSLAELAVVQNRVFGLYERQAEHDVLTLGTVFDEYLRLCASCKRAFGMRESASHACQQAEADVAKKRASQDKLMRQGRSQTDRLNQLSAEVADAEKRSNQSRLLFEDMGQVLRGELTRFEREKVEDFKYSVETFLENAVEAQKEIIEVWETLLVILDLVEKRDLFLDFEDEPVLRRVPAKPTTAGKVNDTDNGVSSDDNDDNDAEGSATSKPTSAAGTPDAKSYIEHDDDDDKNKDDEGDGDDMDGSNGIRHVPVRVSSRPVASDDPGHKYGLFS